MYSLVQYDPQLIHQMWLCPLCDVLLVFSSGEYRVSFCSENSDMSFYMMDGRYNNNVA